ncbi:MAG: hypothetical protein J6S85_26625 [Methanobrevibacter sp.]|nr:hypothetical protein [Methanobrevibacter sp.]MBO7717170.1 hypothetical protein [Methanobrevibacter sp.]
MTVNFYNVTDDPRTVNKNLGSVVASLTLFPYDKIDLYNPVLLLPMSTAAAGCNYFEFSGRYYYISSPPVYTEGQRMIIQGIVDVLKTYANSIANCSVAVIRNEGNGATDIIDTSYPVNPSEIWYQGIVLTGNKLSENFYPYLLSINASYS